jgi:hypothetical protein
MSAKCQKRTSRLVLSRIAIWPEHVRQPLACGSFARRAVVARAAATYCQTRLGSIVVDLDQVALAVRAPVIRGRPFPMSPSLMLFLASV